MMGEGAWLVAFLVMQRLAELGFAQWNTVRLRAAGAVEFGAAHYPLLVALHAFWLMGLWVFGHERPVDPSWLAVFILLQAGRIWVVASLGRRWTTRVVVMPRAMPVVCGPYRFLRHPNYAVVTGEIAVLPLMFGEIWVAVVFTILNAAVLTLRIRQENEALVMRRALEAEAGILELTVPFAKQLLQEVLLDQLVPEAVQNRVIGGSILKAQADKALER